MGSNYIPFLILFLIILGQSCVLLLLLLKMRQRIHNLTDGIQHLRNEAKNSKDETDRLKDKTQQLTNEAENLNLSLAKLRNMLSESDRKNEEDRKALKMLMISDLRYDIDTLDKRDKMSKLIMYKIMG